MVEDKPTPDSFSVLPPDLPVPVDDGASDHLLGMTLPDVSLASTSGQEVNLADESETTAVVLFCYPMTGRLGIELPSGWNEIPGARGCTTEACGFRNEMESFRGRGIIVFGLSLQSTEYQREAVDRLQLNYELLSDEGRRLTTELSLPTFEVDGVTYLKRITLVIKDRFIEKVFYPVFPPDKHAEDVMGKML